LGIFRNLMRSIGNLLIESLSTDSPGKAASLASETTQTEPTAPSAVKTDAARFFTPCGIGLAAGRLPRPIIVDQAPRGLLRPLGLGILLSGGSSAKLRSKLTLWVLPADEHAELFAEQLKGAVGDGSW
jgi:hypothetical protein